MASGREGIGWLAAIIACMVCLAYWPGTAAFAVAPKWATLCLVPLLLIWKRVELRAAHWCGMALLAYAALSLLWVPVLWEGLDGMMKLLLVAACFMVGSILEPEDMPLVYEGFAWGVTASALIATAQYLGWSGLDQLVAPAGLFGNKNFMGEAAALALVATIGRPRFWLAIGPIVALWLSGCREAWIAALIGLMLPFWQAGYRRQVLAAAVMFAGAGLLLSVDHLPDLQVRLDIWRDTLLGLTWTGRGIGSFLLTFPEHARYLDPLLRPEFAHDDALQLLFELGPPGLLAGAVCIFFCCLGGGARPLAILAALGAETLLGFPLHMPATVFLGAVVAGRLAQLGPDLRAVLAVLRAPGATRLALAGRALHQVPRA